MTEITLHNVTSLSETEWMNRGKGKRKYRVKKIYIDTEGSERMQITLFTKE